jgi:hypothetical protein
VFDKTAARVADELRNRLGPGRVVLIDESANSFGVQSRGIWQMRGNGCLALTSDEIVFVMWWPRRELRIPRSRITSVEQTKWHLGKTRGRALLKVGFVNEAGAPDSVAWYVTHLAEWKAALAPS